MTPMPLDAVCPTADVAAIEFVHADGARVGVGARDGEDEKEDQVPEEATTPGDRPGCHIDTTAAGPPPQSQRGPNRASERGPRLSEESSHLRTLSWRTLT